MVPATEVDGLGRSMVCVLPDFWFVEGEKGSREGEQSSQAPRILFFVVVLAH